MRTIWKYKLAVSDEQRIIGPLVKPLSVGVQGSDIVLWAIVDPDFKEHRVLRVLTRGTGHPAAGCDELTFLGTVEVPYDRAPTLPPLYFHIFAGFVGLAC